MNPILFAPTETNFNTNGIGILSDAVSCIVTEERNGAFELEMQYPVTGIHYGHIARRGLLLAKPNPVDDAQPFRIYRITRPIGGVVTIYAAHISYDLSGIPVSPFTASSAPEAMAALSANAAVACPFTFWTDKSTAATMTVSAPASIRSLLGGRDGSLLDVYGGEYAFDGYSVRLYGQRGADRGVSIRYGKNLTDLTQEENCQSLYTGCYPYWSGQNGDLVTLPEKILSAEGTYDFVKILPLDLSGEWKEAPTPDALRTRAAAYMKANRIGTPKVSLTVRFAQLEQTEEYKGTALLERVLLCDTVNVEFPALGVSATAKCVKTVYDCLLDRYDKVELGDARATIADTLVEQIVSIEKKPDKTFLQAAVDSATSQITGNKGGYVVLHSSTGAKEPDEVLIMDKPDIATATRVWRWNKSGLGYSSTGYNGPYGLAMTQDGAIVADFITTGTLNAALIKAGVLQSSDGKSFYLDLQTGTIRAIGSFRSSSSLESGLYGYIDQKSSSLEVLKYDGAAVTEDAPVSCVYIGSVLGEYNGYLKLLKDGLPEVLVSCGAGFGVRVVNENGKYAGWLNHDSSNSGALGIQDANGNRIFSASRNSEGKGTLVMGDSSGNSEVFAQYDTDGVKMWLKSLNVTDATGFANFSKLYVGNEIQLKGDMRIAVDGGGYSGWTWKNIVTADGSNAMVLCHTY